MGTPAKPTVVLTPVLETVDDMFRREFCRPPDQALLALARSGAVGRVVAADPWRSWPAEVVRRRSLVRRSAVDVGGRQITRVRPRRLRRSHPVDVRQLEVQSRRYAEQVGRLAGLSRRSGAGLVTYDPFVAAFAEADWIERLVYVGRDDFASAPRKRPWWPAYEEAYRRIARRCDAVFTVSDELGGRVAPGRAVTVPNGVDPAVWEPRPAPDPLPGGVEGVYAVYAGSVEGRVDESLFQEVLEVVPQVVVAGACFDEEQQQRLERMEGVRLLGSLNQRDLAAVVSGAAVGLIPHRDTPMTRAMSPLKMYEYLAAGIPVVATDLPPVADGGSRVFRCTERADWAPAVRRALAAGVQSVTDRSAAITAMSWGTRLRPVVAAAVAPGRAADGAAA